MPNLRLICVRSTENYSKKDDTYRYTYVFADMRDEEQTFVIHSDSNYGYVAGNVYELVAVAEEA